MWLKNMQIQIEMGPNFLKVASELGSMGRAILAACSRGLSKGANLAADNVVRNYLTGQALKRRSGNLARAVDDWMEGDYEAVVGVREGSGVSKYAWLLGDESIPPITPKKGKFLAIPIGEGLTPAGAARYSSPRQVPGGFFVNTGGRLLFGIKRGKRGKFRALFTLVKSVLVQPTGALYDGVEESLDDITDSMQTEIDKATGAD